MKIKLINLFISSFILLFVINVAAQQQELFLKYYFFERNDSLFADFKKSKIQTPGSPVLSDLEQCKILKGIGNSGFKLELSLPANIKDKYKASAMRLEAGNNGVNKQMDEFVLNNDRLTSTVIFNNKDLNDTVTAISNFKIYLKKDNTIFYSGNIYGVNTDKPEPQPIKAKTQSNLTLFVDEDFLLGKKNEDRNYTGGLFFKYTHPMCKSIPLLSFIQSNLDKIFGKYNELANRNDESTGYYFFGGSSGFTPAGTNLKVTAPIKNDRPYACLTAVARGKTNVDIDKDKAVTTEFTLGLIGLNIMRDFQTGIHRAFKHMNGIPDSARPYYPKGWNNQISNGAEPTILYRIASNNLLLAKHAEGSALRLELTQQRECAVGYYNYINYGLNTRAGFIKSEWYNFNANPTGAVAQNKNTALQDVKDTTIQKIRTVTKNPKKYGEVYGFASASVMFMAYNALLQGQFRPSIVTASEGEVKHLLLIYEAGIVLHLRCVELRWTILAGRSPEFKTDIATRWHKWGAIYITTYF